MVLAVLILRIARIEMNINNNDSSSGIIPFTFALSSESVVVVQ